MPDMAKELFDPVVGGRSPVNQIFAPEEAAAAHRASESRSTSGETVLIP